MSLNPSSVKLNRYRLRIPQELINNILEYLLYPEILVASPSNRLSSLSLAQSDTQVVKGLAQICPTFRLWIRQSHCQYVTTAVILRNQEYSDMSKEMVAYFSPTQPAPIGVVNLIIHFVVAEATAYPYLMLREPIRDICTRIIRGVQPRIMTVVLPSSLLSHLVPPTQHNVLNPDDYIDNVINHTLELSDLQPHNQAHTRAVSAWNEPWSCARINEGSSLDIYSRPDQRNKKTASLFNSQSFRNSVLQAEWSINIRKFEYVAVFPLSAHMSHVLVQLQSLQNLQNFKIRLTPPMNSPIFSDLEELGQYEYADLWLELAENYRLVANFVVEMGKKHQAAVFRPLDYDNPDIFSVFHPGFTAKLENWGYADSTWSKG